MTKLIYHLYVTVSSSLQKFCSTLGPKDPAVVRGDEFDYLLQLLALKLYLVIPCTPSPHLPVPPCLVHL